MKYTLFDLDITTIGDPTTFNCSHVVGDGFTVRGENLAFKTGTTQFSHYVLASLAPYLAAKQRTTDKADWMYFEDTISCPDPQCGALFAIKRTAAKTYEYN
jgi:uncharacterized repeat protein (TIGR04076 family)